MRLPYDREIASYIEAVVPLIESGKSELGDYLVENQEEVETLYEQCVDMGIEDLFGEVVCLQAPDVELSDSLEESLVRDYPEIRELVWPDEMQYLWVDLREVNDDIRKKLNDTTVSDEIVEELRGTSAVVAETKTAKQPEVDIAWMWLQPIDISTEDRVGIQSGSETTDSRE
jgi:hypothetical protein